MGVGGINGDGQVVGSYNNSSDCLTSCSFILDVTMGAFTKIVYPGGSYTTALGTNNNGQLVASATTSNGSVTLLYDENNGAFSTLPMAGALESAGIKIKHRSCPAHHCGHLTSPANRKGSHCRHSGRKTHDHHAPRLELARLYPRCKLIGHAPNALAPSCNYCGVINRTGTGEEPVTGIEPTGIPVPLPQPATFRMVTLTLPY